ncbi:MAG: hypothetical protein N5P05_002824 [Chroococcopsis gigantea SAG 12.99]|jgi:hypothetical protein|nr:hypothetical protein [Chlorogloea purpurea SAG 13.99]MDV3001218.1 hypothetical protein [Chroococcopsis gigantea SAG 12.99]
MSSVNSVQEICTHLEQIEQVDPVTGAVYREQAQDIIATTTVDLEDRKTVAECLSDANQILTLKTVGKEDSY